VASWEWGDSGYILLCDFQRWSPPPPENLSDPNNMGKRVRCGKNQKIMISFWIDYRLHLPQNQWRLLSAKVFSPYVWTGLCIASHKDDTQELFSFKLSSFDVSKGKGGGIIFFFPRGGFFFFSFGGPQGSKKLARPIKLIIESYIRTFSGRRYTVWK